MLNEHCYNLIFRLIMMMIAPNSHAHRDEKKGEVKGKLGSNLGKEEGDSDYGEMVRTTLQGTASYEKEVQ